MHGFKCSKNNLISLSKALPVTGYSFLGHLMRLCSLLSIGFGFMRKDFQLTSLEQNISVLSFLFGIHLVF